MSLPLNSYGQQFILDGYEADQTKLGDVGHLYNFLMDLPARIGMTRVGFPHIIHIDEPGIKGLSGFVFIMESHISIHTYEERGFITIDVYSCKTFVTETLCEHIISSFGIQSHEQQLLIRGARFGEFPTHTV